MCVFYTNPYQLQILGWYNIDGSANGKHIFVRDRDGTFHELPLRENGVGCVRMCSAHYLAPYFPYWETKLVYAL